MWVSNTATAVMMLPIGVSVLVLVAQAGSEHAGEDLGSIDANAAHDSDEVKDAIVRSNFGTALMLGIAYAASIGSLGTIIGTPPNTLLVGYMAENFGVRIGFGQWMLVGVPIVPTIARAISLCRFQRCMPSASMNPPMNRKMMLLP